MTADWFVFPADVLRRISSRITNEVEGINRVTYDISSKPPAVCHIVFLDSHELTKSGGRPLNGSDSGSAKRPRHLNRIYEDTRLR